MYLEYPARIKIIDGFKLTGNHLCLTVDILIHMFRLRWSDIIMKLDNTHTHTHTHKYFIFEIDFNLYPHCSDLHIN